MSWKDGTFSRKTPDPVSRKLISSIPTEWLVKTTLLRKSGGFRPGMASVKPGLAEVHTLLRNVWYQKI